MMPRSILIFLFLQFSSYIYAASPNIVLIVADNLSPRDVSAFGATDIKTPNIDALVANGAKFSNIYAMSSESTPSRASLLTGRYPQRFRGLDWSIGIGNRALYPVASDMLQNRRLGFSPYYALLTPALKRAGYCNAVFGKWHLGYDSRFNPLNHGFHEFTGFLGSEIDYYEHRERSHLPVYFSGNMPIEREGYITSLITEDAVDFINRSAQNEGKPFFLYLPHAAPHYPYQLPTSDGYQPIDEAAWEVGTRSQYLEMVRTIDDSVGSIVKALNENELLENTLIVFTSARGNHLDPTTGKAGENLAPVSEQALRVPLAIQWPGVLKKGTVCHQVGSLMDLAGGLINSAGAKLPQGMSLDGDDLIEHARTGGKRYARTLCWRTEHGMERWKSIRRGDMKYVTRTKGKTTQEWLYNVHRDTAEQTNLINAEKHKNAVVQMKRRLKEWEKRVDKKQ